jgi:hypothetical protein
MMKYGAAGVLAMDETFWNLHPSPLPHVSSFTPSGWCREGSVFEFIETIILPYTGGQPCLLLLDSYRAHLNFSYSLAPSDNIELAIVPACMTATFSPLDVVINPTIKAIGKGKFRKICSMKREEGEPIGSGAAAFAPAVAGAVEALDAIKTTTVQRAFREAIGDLSVESCQKAHKNREREREERERERRDACEPLFHVIDSIVSSVLACIPHH